MKKMKVLLIQSVISGYRVPVYNIIAESLSLTVLYSEGKAPENVKFNTVKVESGCVGPFKYFKQNIGKYAKDYDVVIPLMDPTNLSILFMLLNPFKKYKVAPWGIGVPASYNVRYDSPSKWNTIYRLIVSKSDALIFYTSYPVDKYSNMGYDRRKMFVAPNTVEVCNEVNSSSSDRDIILFVGSLYKQKGIEVLLFAYQKAWRKNSSIPPLYIIGGGGEYDYIKKWIIDNDLDYKIILEGPIYDENVLATYFNRAIACISPYQAGLSVQKSMGYSVPFVTRFDSITGGERLDIVNGVNGVLYESDDDLSNILLDICSNKNKYVEMGYSGRDFYIKNRTISHMAQGVIDAINYISSKNNENQ